MIAFAFPAAFFLMLPLAIGWLYSARHGSARWWRLLILCLVVTALAQPSLRLAGGGSDVIFVADRSHSMSASLQQQTAYLELIAAQRGPHDRLGIVSCGAGAEIIQGAQQHGVRTLAHSSVENYASDLRSGIELARSLIAPGRNGRIVIHSDGAYTDRNPADMAPELATLHIPVDVLLERTTAEADAAILDIELPAALRLGESFIAAVVFWADQEQDRQYRIMRDGVEIHSGMVHLLPHSPQVIEFPDRPHGSGIIRYTVELDSDHDRNPANNTANAVMRIDGGEHILVMSGDGSDGNIARALKTAGMRVRSIPEGAVSLHALSACRTLILDRVPAHRLGYDSMQRISTWVRHLGGSLILTGGKRSFGAGGYHRSAIEDILPVSMELRDEHRKLSVALAITLDRSGSMMARVPSGQTKMDLANEGTVAAIELLSARDSVAVHAVDSAPHIIVPMTPLTDTGDIINRVRRIGSMGGGIYVYPALVAAGAELLRQKNASTLHLVLFADAADAEEPGDYQNLLADYQSAGITVSVIGLGNEHDSDAAFLIDVAKRGGGRIHFTDNAADVPRLFAQETVLIARSSWVSDAVTLRPLPQLALLLGQHPLLNSAWPQVQGYNLTYLKDHAQAYALCPGDPEAPAIAAWHVGSGRSIAIGFQLDDPSNAALLAWDGYAPLITSLARWAAAEDANTLGQLLCQRTGQTLRVTLELDPALRDQWPALIPDLNLISGDAQVADAQIPWVHVDDGRYEAITQLARDYVCIPAVTLNDTAILGAAQCLPYNPEDVPRDARLSDSDALSTLAHSSGGTLRRDVIDIYNLPPSTGTHSPLSHYLIICALLCVLIEIAVRRMHLRLPFQRAFTPRTPKTTARPQATVIQEQPQNPTPAPSTHNDTAQIEKDQGLHEALRQLRNSKKNRR